MRTMLAFAFAVAVLCSAGSAEEVKSGLQAGQGIGAFQVVKVAGPDDGVKVGTELCYRCKYGARPQVMVFTRDTGADVGTLAKQLDELVAKNAEKKLAAFVNVVGENREKLEASAKTFAETNKLANVPSVVPVEFENGPQNYGLDSKASVTVILAKGGKVTSSFGFAKFNADAAKTVIADVAKILE